MKFWKKFWKLVSKRDLIFGSIIFVLVIVLTFFESANKVTVKFGEEAVDIKAPKYSMNIPYEMVASVELVEIPDRGETEDGRDDMVTRTGLWNNEAWGEYYACLDLQTTNCIVVHLNDGRIFVFSRRSNDETAAVFETFQTYLPAPDASAA